MLIAAISISLRKDGILCKTRLPTVKINIIRYFVLFKSISCASKLKANMGQYRSFGYYYYKLDAYCIQNTISKAVSQKNFFRQDGFTLAKKSKNKSSVNYAKQSPFYAGYPIITT